MIFWYLLTLDIFSNKLIIGEEWNSQLIFPSVSQELKLRHAAPLNTSSSWVIFILILERRDPILWVLWDNTYHVRLWGSAPSSFPTRLRPGPAQPCLCQGLHPPHQAWSRLMNKHPHPPHPVRTPEPQPRPTSTWSHPQVLSHLPGAPPLVGATKGAAPVPSR